MLGTGKLTTRAGFSLVEILIVVAIIGILAAIAIPLLEDQSQKAKESVAKENLQNIRNIIERYAVQHKGVAPGFPNGDITQTPVINVLIFQLTLATNSDGAFAAQGTVGYPLGPYLTNLPENPLNNLSTFYIIKGTPTTPAEPTGTTGWVYNPLTKTVKLNSTGKDSQGVPYYDY